MNDVEKRRMWLRVVEDLAPEVDAHSLALLDRLHALAHALHRRGEASVTQVGLSYAQFRVLMLLLFAEIAEQRRGLHPSEISARRGTSRNTVSSLLADLESREMINRQTDNEDRRKVVVGLTDRGRDTVRDHLTRHLVEVAEIFDCLERDERATLLQLLQKLETGPSAGGASDDR